MGIIKPIETGSGIVVNEAYGRIDTLSGSKSGLDITVNYYVSQGAFHEGKGIIEKEIHHFEPSVGDVAPNFIKQGYEYIKTLPEFEDALDVLDD